MKLAEALQERADLNRSIEQLRQRIENNCLVQEGEQPVESPTALMAELDACVDRLQTLIVAINRTNSALKLGDRTLTNYIAERDCLRLKLSACQSFVSAASENTLRARMNEIKILPAINVPETQQKVNALARRLREVDNAIQAANWQLDLIEE
jgi:hypothetical protein